MTTTTLPLPAHLETIAFYERCRPLVEQLASMALEWREAASAEALPAAIEAHGECLWLAIRLDLRLSRCRGERRTKGTALLSRQTGVGKAAQPVGNR